MTGAKTKTPTTRGGGRRVRPLLLGLLWAWALCVFLILDLFLNVEEFDAVRPRARLYRATRFVAHKMVGEPYDDGEFALVARDRVPWPGDFVTERREDGTEVERGVKETATGERVDHGPWTMWYADGSRAETGAYRDGKRHGSWTRWFPGGQVSEVARFEKGVRVGSRIRYHENGTRAAEGEYDEGARTGRWTFTNADGTKAGEEEFSKGTRDGRFVRWHRNGLKSEEGRYRRGKRHGRWTSRTRRRRTVRAVTMAPGARRAIPASPAPAWGLPRSHRSSGRE